ncbi:EAL domain-containing protein [Zoogloeaceae bacterium G21618-S1]|nr:EAL domain-containing protein [Zoogloeaceae bacterium G21618-S1]
MLRQLKLRSIPLSVRIAFGAISLIVLAAFSLIQLIANDQHARLFSSYHTTLSKTLEYNGEALKANIADIRSSVAFLAGLPPVSGIARALNNKGIDPVAGGSLADWRQRLEQIISRYAKSNPNFLKIRLLKSNESFQELVRVERRGGAIVVLPANEYENNADIAFLKNAATLTPGNVLLSRISLEDIGVSNESLAPRFLQAATTVITPNGDVFGILIVDIAFKQLTDAILNNLPDRVGAYLSDSEGRYLYAPEETPRHTPAGLRPTTWMQQFPGLVLSELDARRTTASLIDTDTGPMLTIGSTIRADPARPTRSLTLIYALPESVITEGMAESQAKAVIGVGVGSLFVAALLVWMIRRTFVPLAQLARAGEAMACGHYDTPLPDLSDSELSGLGQAFTAMQTNIAQREAEFRAVTATATDAFWALDMNGKIVDVNRACEHLLGYSRAELLTLRLSDLDTEKSAQELLAQIRELVAGGGGLIVTDYRRKNGQKIPVEITISHWPIAGGRLFGFVRDITERRRAEETVRQSEERYRLLFANSPQPMCLFDETSLHFIDVNDAAVAHYGFSRSEFLSMTLLDLHPVRDVPRLIKAIESTPSGRMSGEYQHRTHDGRTIDCVMWTERMQTYTRTERIALIHDITERKRAEHSLRLYANIFERSGEAIVITDVRNHIVTVNPAFTELTGYSPDEVVGKNPKILASGTTPSEVYSDMWRTLQDFGFWQGELTDRRKDGSTYPKWAAISVIHNDAGEITHYMASFTDISDRKAAEERIQYLAHHDDLTGLINRYSLEHRLKQAIHATRREGRHLAVMFIDMDRFKLINDTLGHHVGDHLLQEVAHRLRDCVRESDIVARLGGDEFVVVTTSLNAPVDALTVARDIRESLARPYQHEGIPLHSSPSIGVAVFPEDGRNTDSLMKNADTAMYHAKEQGRNNVQFFTAAMNTAAAERMALETELRRALEDQQFVLHYQPQVETQSQQLRAVEALLRWQHPTRGLMPPMSFIPVAEETGMIEAIGAWVLDEACRQLAEWRKDGLKISRMAVNLSACQLRSRNLVEDVQSALVRHRLGKGDLELEVTETAAMANPEHAIAQLHGLRESGVVLAIDDFGTGYSSLAYLKRLPIQTLKLDRSFVRDIETDPNDAAISAATLALAHSMGLNVVAEGVETEGQRHFLATHRCDVLQGYLFGKPEPADVWRGRWQAAAAHTPGPML